MIQLHIQKIEKEKKKKGKRERVEKKKRGKERRIKRDEKKLC